MSGQDNLEVTIDTQQAEASPGPPGGSPPKSDRLVMDTPQQRIITRSKDTRHTAEQHLKGLLNQVLTETDPDKLGLYDPLLEKALSELTSAHTVFITENRLVGSQPPHADYIAEWKTKIHKTVDKMRHKLFQDTTEVTRSGNLETHDDTASVASLSSRFSTISTTSTGMAGIHKLGQYRKRINSIVQAVSTVLSRPNLPPRALRMVQKQWEPIDQLLDDHTSILDSVVQLLGEDDPRLTTEAPLTSSMVDTVEKARHDLTVALCQSTSPTTPQMHRPSQDPNLTQQLDATNGPHNTGFLGPSQTQMRNSYLPYSAWSLHGATSQARQVPPPQNTPALQLGSPQHGAMQPDQPRHQQTTNMYPTNQFTDVSPGARTKSHLKLPTTKPPYFSGELLAYLPWRRLWKETMGKGYPDPVQLAQLKESLSARVQEIIPLATLHTMDDFWALMDDEYVNFHELARLAVQDIKAVSRKDTRYIQIIRNKLLTYKVDLQQVDLQHRVTSDVMITEHWLPLLPHEIRERWIQDNTLDAGPLWPRFEQFINKQAAAARARERMSQASSPSFGGGSLEKPCSKCQKSGHKSKDCKSMYCARCKAWHIKDKHTAPEPAEGSYCRTCDTTHKFGLHTRQRHNVNLSSAHTCKRCKVIIKSREVNCGACGMVAQPGTSLHCYDHCEIYSSAKPEDRLKYLHKYGDCTVCLGRDHNTEGHKTRLIAQGKELLPCGIKECKSTENASLHGAPTHQTNHIRLHTEGVTPKQAVAQHTTAQATIRRNMARAARKSREEEIRDAQELLNSPEITSDQVLLQVASVPIIHAQTSIMTDTRTIFDNGSTCSLIARRLAKQLKLRAKHIQLTVNTITGTSTIDSEFVVVEMMDKHGKTHRIRAYTVEDVSIVVSVTLPEGLKMTFSTEHHANWPNSRPGGEVLLLVGNEALSIHPTELERVDNLAVYDSLFSFEKMLSGHHPTLQGKSDTLTQNCQFLRSSSVATQQQCHKITAQQTSFLAGEDMGDFTPKACHNCRKCLQCTFAVRSTSRKEQIELDYIAQGVRYDLEAKRFHVTYPYLEDPKEALTDNRKQAIAYGLSLEKTLDKKNLTRTFQQEFQKFVENGSLKELTPDEMASWTGPVHYLPMQLVLNEGSATTPFRIVTNSSCKDPITKKSLNDILAKGPNMLSDPWSILLRFRNYRYALATDVTKAYHQLRTGPVEMHTRRVLYRTSPDQPWQTFAFQCVSFGDRPAAAILEVSLRLLAEKFKEIDEEAALRMLIDRFVDDMPTGHNDLQVIKRFRGAILENFQTSGTLAAIFQQGGYILKVVVLNGDPPGPMVDKLGGAALGLPWDPTTDLVTIPLTVNVSARKKGVPQGQDISPSTIDEIDQAQLTRRICLSITMALYDPLGLITPLTMRLKKLLQDIAKTDNSRKWDDILSQEELKAWRKVLREMVEVGSVTFRRACKPDDIDELAPVVLILFFDGSNTGKAFTAYLRYSTKSGKFITTLLASKAKLNPAGGQSTPRSELDGGALGARGATNITRALMTGISRIYVLGDSTTILQSLKVGSIPFNEYFGNRLNEISERIAALDKSTTVIWGHLESALNGADIASRPDASPHMLGLGSEWQSGPRFITFPEDTWPINTSLAGLPADLPTEELRKQYRGSYHQSSTYMTKHDPADRSDLDNMARDTPTWKSLLQRTRTLLRWWSKVRERNLLQQEAAGLITYLQLELTLASMASDMVLNVWMRHAGRDTIKLMNLGGLANLNISIKEGIPLVQTRHKVRVQKYWGRTELPVVLASTRLGYLICEDAHEQCHRSGDQALTLTKQVAYVVGGKKILTNIRRKCLKCRKENIEPARQQMGDFPPELQYPDPPFTKLGLDLAGPFLIKADIRRRSGRLGTDKTKMWIVIFVCHTTSACKLYISRDYSTEGFLEAWTQHISDMGKPRLVYSDRGTQLVSAAGGLDPFDEEDTMDWAKLAGDTGVKWSFTPAGSQWRNGKAEAVVKGMKHSLRTTYKSVSMDYQELQTSLKQIAHVLNSRPVELMLGQYKRDGGGQEVDSSLPEEFHPITPNDLLLGTGGTGSGPANFEYVPGTKRLAFLRERLESWHKNFVLTCQDRLFITPRRWTKKHPNFRVGDVVYLLKESLVGLTLKWALVYKVHPDDAGVVRDVTVRYSNIRVGRDTLASVYHRPGPFKFKICAIQNLAMMYSKEDQVRDREAHLNTDRDRNAHMESSDVDIMNLANGNQSSSTGSTGENMDLTTTKNMDPTMCPAKLMDSSSTDVNPDTLPGQYSSPLVAPATAQFYAQDPATAQLYTQGPAQLMESSSTDVNPDTSPGQYSSPLVAPATAQFYAQDPATARFYTQDPAQLIDSNSTDVNPDTLPGQYSSPLVVPATAQFYTQDRHSSTNKLRTEPEAIPINLVPVISDEAPITQPHSHHRVGHLVGHRINLINHRMQLHLASYSESQGQYLLHSPHQNSSGQTVSVLHPQELVQHVQDGRLATAVKANPLPVCPVDVCEDLAVLPHHSQTRDMRADHQQVISMQRHHYDPVHLPVKQERELTDEQQQWLYTPQVTPVVNPVLGDSAHYFFSNFLGIYVPIRALKLDGHQPHWLSVHTNYILLYGTTPQAGNIFPLSYNNNGYQDCSHLSICLGMFLSSNFPGEQRINNFGFSHCHFAEIDLHQDQSHPQVRDVEQNIRLDITSPISRMPQQRFPTYQHPMWPTTVVNAPIYSTKVNKGGAASYVEVINYNPNFVF